MYLRILIIVLFSFTGSLTLSSQPPVIGINGAANETLKYPWAGGVNSIQYLSIDLNIDGIMDLVLFDRRGNRKMCFINEGEYGSINYHFSPEYADRLPEFSDWVIFADYDMDGKNDIFTYSPGYAGIIVYHNVSNTDLKFERVVYPYLKTLLPGGYVNLYVTNADYPGIADVDFDGDLDILAFGVLGSFIDFHKNMSMEKYGIPDSLDFEHVTYCWGHVAESDESNQIYLDTCYGKAFARNTEQRHVGSTFLIQDIDNNGLVDILLGDVDYPQLFALYNNGSLEDALITNYSTIFPGDQSVDLFSMPCAFYLDVDNDNIKDMLVSSFDPGPTTSQDKVSSWYYKNNGTNSLPDLDLIEKDFLQNGMIDMGTAAYPVVFDWDKDGLVDLFIGNYGNYVYSYYENGFLKSVYYSRISYYRNIGTEEKPKFQLWDNDFGKINTLKLKGYMPAFSDINNDGLTDMLVGNESGKLLYLENDGNDLNLVTDSFQNIDIGDFSTPQLFDLDNDGDDDLIIGERSGNFNYYENTGNSVFSYITDSLGKVNVTDYSLSYDGYSVPSFFKVENNTYLISGSEQGQVFYYTDIDGNIEGKFTESSELHVLLDTADISFDRGMRTSATIVDFYNNDKIEMMVGNFSGGIEYFNGNADVNSYVENIVNIAFLNSFPNPATDLLRIDYNKNDITNVSVIGSTGKRISPIYTTGGSYIELNLLPFKSGLYLVKIETENETYLSKFIISK